MSESRRPVPPQAWRRIFQDDPDGAAILEELCAEFHDKPLLEHSGEAALVSEGGRRVILHILQKCTQEQGG